jgi:hypothetical protein
MKTLEKVDYYGWPNSYRLSNGAIELIATSDVGPRLIHFGFVGGENEFATAPDMMGKRGGSEWRLYGGHRFWHAPEHPTRTYCADNAPVALEEHEDFVRLIQETEALTGIQKEIDVELDPEKARVRVNHRLLNRNVWPVELAPWALSVMAPGGVGIVPLPPRGTHAESLLPANTLSMWAYTDMSDPRWTWGRENIMLQQDPDLTEPQKIGVMSLEGWVAYARRGHLFVKSFEPIPGDNYPDLNSTVEMFTNEMMLEIETLGPMVRLEPGTAVTHSETWDLFGDVPLPRTEADVIANILPKMSSI